MMTTADAAIALLDALRVPVGRHLYAIVGSYSALRAVETTLGKMKLTDGTPFPSAVSVTDAVLATFSDEEMHRIVHEEARRPEPTRASVQQAFNRIVREQGRALPVLVMKDLELLFAYETDFQPLRALATDATRIVLLLPGRRSGERVRVYPDADQGKHFLPKGLIADNHLFEVAV